MTFTLKRDGSDRTLTTDSPLQVASTLRIPLTMIMRVGESIKRNNWTARRIA